MKSCPLCAEEIKDDAIRCKHCGGDIAAHEDNLQSQLASQKSQASSKASSDKRKKIGTIILAAIGVIYGLVAAAAFISSYQASIMTIILSFIVLPVISAIVLPIAWNLGVWLGRLNQADTIYATQGNLAGARISNYLYPVIGGFVACVMSLGMIGVGAYLTFSNVSVVKPATVSVDKPATVSVVKPTPVSVVEPTPVSVVEPAREAAAAPTSFTPSFDCVKATTGSEQLVCSNSDLSALDVKLSQIYQQVMSKSNDC